MLYSIVFKLLVLLFAYLNFKMALLYAINITKDMPSKGEDHI